MHRSEVPGALAALWTLYPAAFNEDLLPARRPAVNPDPTAGRGINLEGYGLSGAASSLFLRSESKQPVYLNDERSALEFGERLRRERVALLVVDDEQLAPRLILPPEPNVGTHTVVA